MDTMNKLAKKMISGLLCLCYALGADGQTLTDGQIAVQNLAVSKQEDKLFVAMDLDISALKQGSNREVLFTPSLTLEDDSLSLPAVRIAGRNRYYHHLRNASDTERLYRNGERDLIEYRVTVPYEKWMGRARLSATETTCGCCDAPLDQHRYAPEQATAGKARADTFRTRVRLHTPQGRAENQPD